MQKLKFNSSKEIPALCINHMNSVLLNHGGVLLYGSLTIHSIWGGSHAPQAAVLSVVLYNDVSLD